MAAGRPLTPIDWEQFDKLCAIQSTLREIAGWFDCSEDTIERACIREKEMKFAEYFALRSSKGKISLRRKQYEMAMAGVPSMAIWLGKQWLGQTDKQENFTHLSSEPEKLVINFSQRSVDDISNGS